jgi:hypothetical protein
MTIASISYGQFVKKFLGLKEKDLCNFANLDEVLNP